MEIDMSNFEQARNHINCRSWSSNSNLFFKISSILRRLHQSPNIDLTHCFCHSGFFYLDEGKNPLGYDFFNERIFRRLKKGLVENPTDL